MSRHINAMLECLVEDFGTDWVIGIENRKVYVGIGWDEMKGTDHNTVPPDPGWTVWEEGWPLSEVLARALDKAEKELMT